MTNKTASKPIVKLKIESGLVSPAARRAWSIFWKRLIAQAKSEAAK